MIEERLEAALAAKIQSLNLDGVKVFRFWGVADGDDATELPDDGAFIDIMAENRAQETWEMPQFDFPISILLRSRIDLDATGEKHLARVSALVALLMSYCGRSGSANLRADFSVGDEFIPALVSLGGGNNVIDRDDGIRSWSQSITIRGYLH